MTDTVITPAEAMGQMERLRIDVSLSRRRNEWCASRWEPDEYDNRPNIGWGATPLEAVANLLERIAADKAKAVAA